MRDLRNGLMLGVALACLPLTGSAGVIISEIMFDPEGSDTSLEWVEIYNDGSDSVNLSGWQLYPDGIGYYTFGSEVVIGGRQYLVVNLRGSGTDSASVLHHSSATSNAGNSSGSFALFSGEPRSKETIKSFVRYHKPGSTEKKTWESSAAEAGIWQAGNFVDISAFSEGKSITYSGSAWSIGTPTKGMGSASSPASPDISESNATTSASFSFTPFIEVPHLKLELVTHPHAIAGASHRFQARAFSENGKPVDSRYVRFLWNFGDGVIAEGPAITHTYRFPGSYTISLNANTDSALGVYYTDITVRENSLKISEVVSGEEGYIKLTNDSSTSLDLTGWIMRDQKGNSFTIPLDTKLKERRSLILPNEVTALDSASALLYYPNLRLAASTATSVAVGEATSIPSRNGPEIVSSRPSIATLALAEEESHNTLISTSGDDLALREVIEGDIEDKTAALPKVPSRWTFFFLVLGIGILGGAATVWLKRLI